MVCNWLNWTLFLVINLLILFQSCQMSIMNASNYLYFQLTNVYRRSVFVYFTFDQPETCPVPANCASLPLVAGHQRVKDATQKGLLAHLVPLCE